MQQCLGAIALFVAMTHAAAAESVTVCYDQAAIERVLEDSILRPTQSTLAYQELVAHKRCEKFTLGTIGVEPSQVIPSGPREFMLYHILSEGKQFFLLRERPRELPAPKGPTEVG